MPVNFRGKVPKGFVPIPAKLLRRMEEIRVLAEANRKKDASK